MLRPCLALLLAALLSTAGAARAGPTSAPSAAPQNSATASSPIGFRQLVDPGFEAASGNTLPVEVLEVPKPRANPGPQPDIAITKIGAGDSLASLAADNPALAPAIALGEPCRIDWIERCAWVSEKLADTLYEAFRRVGSEPSAHSEPYYYLSRFGPQDRLIISRTEAFGEGGVSLVNALADREGNVLKIFEVPFSRSRHGFEAGSADANVAVLSAAEDDTGAVYLTIDTPSRCSNRSRKAGLLVKADSDLTSVAWVSPFNVSDTNVVFRGDRIYAASGGSCEKDYLYELDRQSGRVTARNVLSTAADFLVATDEVLLVDLYEGAEAYRFR
ncbi:hypothetical protein [Jiella marina]|uniref:hypothetical protein n=1 Tax=Jiella sp. LLJ827 TaxID=2917712 RepID=UPI0021017FC5|nr:hypothetical protein [Jiella sp. LLJ827]MCQ0986632.1 hypothetical protein [Jiella sp. LLJ827]